MRAAVVKLHMKINGTGSFGKLARACNKAKIPITTRLGLGDFVKEVFLDAMKDHLGAFAAALAYRALFAVLPFLVFLLSLLGIFHQASLVNKLFAQVSLAMPHPVVRLLRGQILKIAESQARGAFTLSAIVSILIALWVASGAFRSITEAMNVMYGVEDSRPILKRYLLGVLLSLAVAGLLLSAAVLLAFGSNIGNAIASQIGLGWVFTLAWNVLQWPILIFFVLLAFALVYYYAPDVEQRFRFITPGSVLGVSLWMAFTVLFLIFVNHFGVFNHVYGALAGIAIHMLYMYYTSYILLLGANVNQIIEVHSHGGKRTGEKQLPDQDTANSAL